MVNLRINLEEEVWKKSLCQRIRAVGREAWKDGFKNIEIEHEYVRMKECHRKEIFQMAVLVLRLMVRGGCLSVSGSETMH